jgi:hypothetical protein
LPSDPFEAWLSRLADDPELDFDPRDPAALGWLREVHRDDGEVTTPWLHRLIFERRRWLAEELLVHIRREAEAEVGPLPGLGVGVHQEPSPEFPSGLVVIEDVAIRAVDPAGAAVEVADGVQTVVAQSRHLIWPQCPVHGNGLHPELFAGEPQWVCGRGPHPQRAIVEIGLLAGPGSPIMGA